MFSMKQSFPLFCICFLPLIQSAAAQWESTRHPLYDAASPIPEKVQNDLPPGVNPEPEEVIPDATMLEVASATDRRITGGSTYPFGTFEIPLHLNLRAWRGERCSAQIGIRANGQAKQLSVSCSGLSNGKQTIPAVISLLGYTKAHDIPTADVITRDASCDNPVGIVRGAWLQIDVPQNTAPGLYRGTITVSAVGCEPVQQDVSLLVEDATLPNPADWSIHLDLWQHPQSVARWHDVEPWSPEHFALLKPLMKRLAEAGQKCITCTLLDEAWNAQTYDWFPSMVRWIRGKDGIMRYDYTALDAWIHFMHDEIGIREQISCYSMIPWHLSVRFFDETTGKYASIKAKPGTPEYDQLWAPFMRDFRKHMQEKGWADKTCIAIDERPDAYVRAAMKLVQENAPEFRFSSAVDKPSELTREVYNISPVITHAGTALGELLRERKAAGKITTFYVCLHPDKPNTYTHSVPAEAEWLGLFAAANHLDGFLRWAYNSWNRNPFETTDFVSWPSGDCFLVYPGNRSSVRFERLRDGIEDFEKINLLRSRAAASPQAAKIIADMDRKLLEIFSVERSKGSTHTQDVIQAQQIISNTLRALSEQPALIVP